MNQTNRSQYSNSYNNTKLYPSRFVLIIVFVCLGFFFLFYNKLSKLEGDIDNLGHSLQVLNAEFISTKLTKKENASLHNSSFNQLLKLDKIFKMDKIEYWLDWGSLLGAARHGNFIPWDNDIDIATMRKNRNKILELLDKHNIKYTMHRNCKHASLINIENFVDIFFYDDLDSAYQAKMINMKVSYKLSQFFKRDSCSVVNKFYNKETGFINDSADKIIRGGPNGNIKARIFNKSDVFPLVELKFNDRKFPVPKNFDLYLTQVYGKWRFLPKDYATKVY